MRLLTLVLITMLLVLSFISNLFAFEPQFITRLDYKSFHDYSTTILVADFDGDGDEDVFDGIGLRGIYINFNTQEGILSHQTFRGIADEVDIADIADIDNDGDIDLITGHNETFYGTSYVIRVQLNNGSGYFEEDYAIVLDKQIYGLHAVDMDSDGDQDLIVRYYFAADGATLFTNDGTGNLTASGIDYSFPDHIWELGFGDIDNDGDIDIVPGRFMADTILVYFNNGDGSLAEPIGYYCPEGGPGISVVDMNNDGHLDIVATEDYVCVMLNQTDGTFGPYLQYDVDGYGPSAMTVDLDGDSYPDVIVDGNSNDGMSVLRNRGDGSLEPAVFYSAGRDPRGLAKIDLNNDGMVEVIVGSDYSISVFTNLGDGTFIDYHGINFGHDLLSAVLAIDLDADGDLDLAVTNKDEDKIMVLMNQGNGSFDLPIDYPAGNEPKALCDVDLDLDGDLDLVCANFKTDDLSVFMNNGDGSFAAAVSYPAGNGPNDVVVADVDKNGYPDICVSNINVDAVSVVLNDGSGQFGSPQNYAMGGNAYSIHAVDLNRDGYVDLVTAAPGYWKENYSEWVPASVWVNYNLGFDKFGDEIYYGSGVQFFAIPEGADGYYTVALSDITSFDVDNDGDLDLALSYTSDGVKGITILNHNNGTFSYDRTLETNTRITQFIAEDLDGDGDIDLVCSNMMRNNVTVFTNNGNGDFGLGVNYGVVSGGWKLCAGDMDGDDQVDLVVAGQFWGEGETSLSILYNTGSGGQIRSCCGQFTAGLTGNTNCDALGLKDLSDITLLIDNVYISKAELCCDENGNINGDPAGIRDLADITALIDYVYITKSEIATCQ